MRALTDQDHPVLERWAGMETRTPRWCGTRTLAAGRSAPSASSHMRCHAAASRLPTASSCFVGTRTPLVEEGRRGRSAPRLATGRWWCSRTCGIRRVAGVDKLQLEYGAEIGRAIVNFAGPIVFCVISRYPRWRVRGVLQGTKREHDSAGASSFASVLGGAPPRPSWCSAELLDRPATDSRVADMQARAAETSGARRAALNAALAETRRQCGPRNWPRWPRSSTRIHSIQRAVDVGSVDAIISVAKLRPRIIDAIAQGLQL